MELPESNLKQKFADEVKIIEANLRDAADGEAPPEMFAYAQKRLDKLADRFQHDKKLGTAVYKLYELQALLHYFQNEDDKALDFIEAAIDIRGKSYARAEQLKENIGTPGARPASAAQPAQGTQLFFYQSPTTVAVLSFITFGFYTIYWAYKHWKTIQDSTGEKVHPILSAIFQIFTAYPLFKRIRTAAEGSGYKKFRRAGWAAACYIALILVLNSTWRATPATQADFVVFCVCVAILSGLVVWPLTIVQAAANAHNRKVMGTQHEFRTSYPGQVIFVIIGVVLGALALVGTYAAVDKQPYDSGASSQLTKLEAEINLLRSQYDSCSSSLSARRDQVNIYDTSAVDAFNRDLQTCEDTRLELNSQVDLYNRLSGYEVQ